MSDRFFTFMLVPEKNGQVRKITLPALYLKIGVGISAFLMILGLFFLFDYLHVLSQVAENKKLRSENHQIRQDILEARGKLESLDQSVNRLKSFAHKLRILGNLDQPGAQRLLTPPEDAPSDNNNFSPDEDGGSIEMPGQKESATKSLKPGMGARHKIPKKTGALDRHDVLEEQRAQSLEPPKATDVKLDLEAQVKDIITSSEQLKQTAELEEQNFASLFEVLQDRVDRLLSTPSILPAQGWITSIFGSRYNPFVGVKSFHAGIDIANNPGTVIQAPAEGLVTFAGENGGFGTVVQIDHGYNIVTKYGHLSKVLVKSGIRVKRGDKIAQMGNSGRSTGTHLHYQVEVNGHPVDPKNFILEDMF